VDPRSNKPVDGSKHFDFEGQFKEGVVTARYWEKNKPGHGCFLFVIDRTGKTMKGGCAYVDERGDRRRLLFQRYRLSKEG
jgi:hypothetical protein